MQAVQDVLELDNTPSIDADFRALGGHSLLAHRLALTLSTALGVRVPVRAVIEEPTLAALAEACANLRDADATDITEQPEPPQDAEPEDGPIEALAGQRRVILAEQLDGENGLYTIPLFATVTGTIDTERLSAALTSVVAAHPVLRSRLSIDDAGIINATLLSPEEALAQPIAVHQRTTTPGSLATFLDELVRTPFPATSDQPLQAYVVQVAEQGNNKDTASTVLALLFHHAFFDEWSLQPFFTDLARAYDNADASTHTTDRASTAFMPSPAQQTLLTWTFGRFANATPHPARPLPCRSPGRPPSAPERQEQPWVGAARPFTAPSPSPR